MRIHLLALPQVLDASLGLSLSIFQAANRLLEAQGAPPAFEVTVTAMEAGDLRTGAGLTVRIPQAATSLAAPDLLMVLGSYLTSPHEVDAWLDSPPVLAAVSHLQGLAAGSCAITASCAGTFVLAHAGLLQGRRATTIWWLSQHFRRRFPKVQLDMQHMVVEDGVFTTAAAALAQGDLVLHLIQRHAGQQLAHACAHYLLMDERGSQACYAMVQHLALQDPQLRQAELWVRARLHTSVRVTDMAAALHLTPRTLARRFDAALGLTPLQFVQRLRTEQALHLLHTTQKPFDAIATQVGYGDPNALRRLLKREAGATPTQLRQRGASRSTLRN